ncbi:MAG: hypothetical protein J5871_01130 [Bacteroidales bacterium]|nr:hypothetical protein [Bacteroidales bacterium]
MWKSIWNKFRILAFFGMLLVGIPVFGQAYGSMTPYSIFGVGDMAAPGTAYNKTMGGVGIAGRTNRHINVLNPASVTARDSLSVLMDFSLYEDNKIFSQTGRRSDASNTFNIGSCILSFPIWRSSAMMVGIMPYSDTGYGYAFANTDPRIIGNVGDVTYSANGSGSLYQVFAGGGVTFWKRLSLGAEFIFLFGDIEKQYTQTFSDASYNGILSGYSIKATSCTGKFGLQYEQPIGTKASVTVGGTYRMGSVLGGEFASYKFANGSAAKDTLDYRTGYRHDIRLAAEIGVGISFRYGDKFMAEFDYTRSDWRNSGFDDHPGFMGNALQSSSASKFTSTWSESYRAGFEYVPNRNDVRYFFRKVAYRAGGYYKREYFLLDGNPVQAYGITLGATIPVFRWYNGLTVGFEFGQRGSLRQAAQVQETCFNLSFGVNLFDIWFKKLKYE